MFRVRCPEVTGRSRVGSAGTAAQRCPALCGGNPSRHRFLARCEGLCEVGTAWCPCGGNLSGGHLPDAPARRDTRAFRCWWVQSEPGHGRVLPSCSVPMSLRGLQGLQGPWGRGRSGGVVVPVAPGRDRACGALALIPVLPGHLPSSRAWAVLSCPVPQLGWSCPVLSCPSARMVLSCPALSCAVLSPSPDCPVLSHPLPARAVLPCPVPQPGLDCLVPSSPSPDRLSCPHGPGGTFRKLLVGVLCNRWKLWRLLKSQRKSTSAYRALEKAGKEFLAVTAQPGDPRSGEMCWLWPRDGNVPSLLGFWLGQCWAGAGHTEHRSFHQAQLELAVSGSVPREHWAWATAG